MFLKEKNQGDKKMADQNPVEGTFESYSTYWNGKFYGKSETAYITVTGQRGTSSKVTIQRGAAHADSAGGGCIYGSQQAADAAARSVGLL